MLFFKKRKLKIINFNHSLLMIVGFALVIITGSAYIRVVIQKSAVQEEINRLKAEKEKYEANNNDLSGLLDYFASESYKEREMRLKLNIQKPGERVVIISRPDKNEVINSILEPDKNSLAFSNIKKWKEYFFGK